MPKTIEIISFNKHKDLHLNQLENDYLRRMQQLDVQLIEKCMPLKNMEKAILELAAQGSVFF